MKKKLLSSLLIVAVLTAASVLPSYADGVTVTNGEAVTVAPDGANSAEDSPDKDNIPAQAEYVAFEGKVSDITDSDGYKRISLENENGGIVGNIKQGTTVIDSKDMSYKKTSDIASGDRLMFIIPGNSPMTASLPPISSSVRAIIIEHDGINVKTAVFDENMTDSENTLKLNIADSTPITHIDGSKVRFTKDDIKNKQCLVTYTVSTRSIPAQTTPLSVMILSGDMSVDPTVDVTVKKTGLRELAESHGYTVEWSANDKPVVIKNKSSEITVVCGSDIITVDGKEEKLESAVSLEESKMMVSADIAVFLNASLK